MNKVLGSKSSLVRMVGLDSDTRSKSLTFVRKLGMDGVGRLKANLMTNGDVTACVIYKDRASMILVFKAGSPSGLVKSTRDRGDEVVNRNTLTWKQVFVLERGVFRWLHYLFTKLDTFVLHNRLLSLLAKLTCRTLWYVTVSNLTPVP